MREKTLMLITTILVSIVSRGQETICHDQNLGDIVFKKNNVKLRSAAIVHFY